MNFKATVLACVTFLAGIAFVIMYASQQDRYAIFAQDKAIFVFDRKNATLNYCNDHACQLITPYAGENGAMPAQMAIMNGQAGVMQMAQIAQPFMPQMAPQSSLQAPAAPIQQPQQVVLVASPQVMKAPTTSAPAPVSAAPATAGAVTPAAEAPAEAPADAPAEAPAE